MLIQTAPAGEKRFISSMAEHLDLCTQFARVFGNADFEKFEPYEEVLYTIGHHDRGWDDLDANPVLDADTGFPAGLGSGPVPGVVTTSKLSPDYNEAKHAYCGLLSSMHSWGLYNDRYGFSQFRVLDGGKSVPIPPGQEDTVNALLDGEIARQKRLKEVLIADPVSAIWVEEQNLMRNYKLLQFFDTLALYFNMKHESEQKTETFVNVPKTANEDTEITITPLGAGKYRLFPFPFTGTEISAYCKGRYFAAIQDGNQREDLAKQLFSLPVEQQSFFIVAT